MNTVLLNLTVGLLATLALVAGTTWVVRRAVLAVFPGLRERAAADRGARRRITLASIPVAIALLWLAGYFVVIPAWYRGTNKHYIVAIKGELRNLVTAQDAYRADNARFADAIGRLSLETPDDISLFLTVVSESGGVATGTNRLTPQAHCAVAWGDAVNPVDSSADAGTPRCAERYRNKTYVW